VALSARDVQEALEERILRAVYPRGAALPSVRALAAELGASPSTVGRALQELGRQGWVSVESRRGAVVRRRLPAVETGGRDVGATLRRLAVRWRLGGDDRESFEGLVRRVADEVFEPEPRTLFLECNPVDLERMVGQVQQETTVRVEPLLLERARAEPGLVDAAVLLTPYFHLAEARELARGRADVVPLNFVASEETMRVLVELAPETRVGVVAVDDRSRRRLQAIVRQYSPARVRGALLTGDRTRVERLVAGSDVVVTTHAARLSDDLLARARQLVRVEFVLVGAGLAPAARVPAAGAGVGR